MRDELIDAANMQEPSDCLEVKKPVRDVIVEYHCKDKALCEGTEFKITTSQTLIHQYLDRLTAPEN